MKNGEAIDTRFEKKMKYYDLYLNYWEIANELWHEYPDEMDGSLKKQAEKMLQLGFIKCKHEK